MPFWFPIVLVDYTAIVSIITGGLRQHLSLLYYALVIEHWVGLVA